MGFASARGHKGLGLDHPLTRDPAPDRKVRTRLGRRVLPGGRPAALLGGAFADGVHLDALGRADIAAEARVGELAGEGGEDGVAAGDDRAIAGDHHRCGQEDRPQPRGLPTGDEPVGQPPAGADGVRRVDHRTRSSA